jgi:hypothetical protein
MFTERLHPLPASRMMSIARRARVAGGGCNGLIQQEPRSGIGTALHDTQCANGTHAKIGIGRTNSKTGKAY